MNIWTNWNTSGTTLDKTGHHLQTWHILLDIMKSMALQVLPDTPHGMHLGTKKQHCSGTLSMWAPTPNSQNSHK